MAKTIDVVIGGKHFSLIGEDEQLIRNAAKLVDKQVTEMEQKHRTLPFNTVSVLAALNIAGQNQQNEKQKDVDTQYLIDQLNKMSEKLDNSIDL